LLKQAAVPVAELAAAALVAGECSKKEKDHRLAVPQQAPCQTSLLLVSCGAPDEAIQVISCRGKPLAVR